MGILQEYFEGDKPLPKFIPLGSVYKEPNHIFNESPKDVRTASDVPNRLYLGDLELSSFTIDSKGWRAKYLDAAPDTWTLLEYEAADENFQCKTCWRGKAGWRTIAPPDEGYKRIARAPKTSFPSEWDDLMTKRLSERYLVAYQHQPKDGAVMCAFPDGFFMNIVIPIPVPRMRDGIRLLEEFRENTTIKTPVMLYYTLCGSTVLYCLDRCNPHVIDESTIAWHVMETTGFIMLKGPQKHVTPEGLNILDVVRLHYALNIGCTFRELERVVEVLAKAGFVGLKEDVGKEGFPFSAEFKAMIYHEPNSPSVRNVGVQVGDHGDTRRVQYGSFTMLDAPDLLPQMAILRDPVASMKEGTEKIAFVEMKASGVIEKIFKEIGLK